VPLEQQIGCPLVSVQQGWSLAQQVIPPGLLQPCSVVDAQQTKSLHDKPEQQSVSEAHAEPSALHVGWAATERGQALSTAIRATRTMGARKNRAAGEGRVILSPPWKWTFPQSGSPCQVSFR
jgi:hypothetical protein